MLKFLASITALFLVFSNVSYAQTDSDDTPSDLVITESEANETLFYFSSAIPESPALALSGIDSSKLTSVSEMRKFLVTLPTVLRANEGQALALDISPYMLFTSDENRFENLDSYVNSNRAERMLYRTKASFLVREGKEDTSDTSKSTRSLMVFGASTSIFDKSDPLYMLGKPPTEFDEICKDKVGKEARNVILAQEIPPNIRKARGLLVEVDKLLNDAASATSPEGKSVLLEAANKKLGEARLEVVKFDKEQNISSKKIKRAEISTDINFSIANHFEEQKALYNIVTKPPYSSEIKVPKPLRAAYDKCQLVTSQALQLAPALDLGGAFLLRGDAGQISGFENGGTALWFSGRMALMSDCEGERLGRYCSTPISKYLIAGISGRVAADEYVSTGNEALAEGKADTWDVWTGLEYRTPSWQAAARIGYVDIDFQDAASIYSSSGEKWLVSSDIKITKSIWLGLSYGEASGTIDALDGEQFRVALKFSDPERYNVFGTKFEN